MNNNTLLIGLGIIILLGVGAWMFTSGAPAQNEEQQISIPQARIFEVIVADRTLTPNTVTVTQGDQVTIKVTTDEAGEFHISGYEIENDMEAGELLEFSFTADKAGRYNFELHPKVAGEEHEEEESTTTETSEEGEEEEDIVIGAFIVNPR